MKLALVVQRYGSDVSGGAELHCRLVAEHLASAHEVEVLTTCARDYLTWRNDLPEGAEQVNAVTVRRFRVRHERESRRFGAIQERVFRGRHSRADELRWLQEEGPFTPRLIRHIRRARNRFDLVLFFSYRYYHAYHGVLAVPGRALLVPTAERDAAIGLTIFRRFFHLPRAIVYNSIEERAMIQAATGNYAVPGDVVGVGSELPEETRPERARQKFDLSGPLAIYIGRIDENKGCPQLFEFFARYLAETRSALTLVLIGSSILPIPVHPRIRPLGFLPDEDKFDLLAAADLLIMPSFYESLSMVANEAWGLGKPVLANGRCEVLRGQCLRSNAGLFYTSYPEFREALRLLERDGDLRRRMGANGRVFFDAQYRWPVITAKYERVLAMARDSERPLPPAETPGWLAARARTLPPAEDVLREVPETAGVRRAEPAPGPLRAGAPGSRHPSADGRRRPTAVV